ncbi:MAG: NUDIX hydrolase [Bacteroidetes bacterium]|nr:NUDIX hydrolase [Bacteroidota bacterium]
MTKYSYNYPRPAVTVDIIVLRDVCANPEILLIQRLNPPFQDEWALPGGFVDMDETLEQAADRELAEETGLVDIILSQFKTYSVVDRDPRGRTISVVFIGITKAETKAKAGDDAKNTQWFSINRLPMLAFDHEKIIGEAIGQSNL